MTTAESNADREFFAQFLDDYFAECDEHLTLVRNALLRIETFVGRPHVDRFLLDNLFRSFHTLKGISAMVGVREAEQIAHHMEGYLRALRQGQSSLSPEGMDALIAGTKMLEQVIASRRVGSPAPDIFATTARLEDLVSAAQDGPSPDLGDASAAPARLSAPEREGARVWRFVFRPDPSLAGRGINVNVIRARLQEVGELIRSVPFVSPEEGISFEFIVASGADESSFASWRDDGLTWTQHPDSPPAVPAPESLDSTAPVLTPSNLVRVDLARLDDLMRMVGELVVSRSRLDENLRRVEESLPSAEWRDLQENNLVLERQLRYLREGVMRVRMVQIGEIFQRMHFVVRDLAGEYRKKVKLELAGRRTEIDKFLVERMMEPLLHLVRNAISHGLEPESERIARGKPAEGTITLRASTAGETIAIEVEDDGRGIDTEYVAARAREKGLLAVGEILDTARVVGLICAPAFSTREEADRASGRGVGMNVVRKTVLELGGALSLNTRVGVGTRFTIHLPLTLAITDALIVDAGGQRYAVPQSSVNEVIEVEPASVTKLENNEIIRYRGTVLPLLRLARAFGLDEKMGRVFYALIVGSGPDPVAVAVDRLGGQREIVVRTFTDPLVRIAGIAGATELGDGRVVLILDLPALARVARATTTTG